MVIEISVLVTRTQCKKTELGFGSCYACTMLLGFKLFYSIIVIVLDGFISQITIVSNYIFCSTLIDILKILICPHDLNRASVGRRKTDLVTLTCAKKQGKIISNLETGGFLA